jgi:hypothetical protein
LKKQQKINYAKLQAYGFQESTYHGSGHILKKLNDNSYHILIHKDKEELILKDAVLSDSCVLVANEDDLVQVFITNNKIFITQVLEKALPVPSEYKLNGKVTLGIDESQMIIDTNQINMKSKTVNIKAENISLISKATKSISKLYKNITEFIVETANMRSTKITGEDQLEADSKQDIIHSTHSIKAKRSVQANETTALNTQKYNINGGQKETIQ